jgi:hypothetical protein
MEALVALPSEPQRDKALRDGYVKWIRMKGQEALDWMPKEALSDERYSPLIDSYAIAVSKSNPAEPDAAIREAVAWAERLENPETRQDTLIMLGMLWADHDPEAARRWIDERGLAGAIQAEQDRKLAAARDRKNRRDSKKARADRTQNAAP